MNFVHMFSNIKLLSTIKPHWTPNKDFSTSFKLLRIVKPIKQQVHYNSRRSIINNPIDALVKLCKL